MTPSLRAADPLLTHISTHTHTHTHFLHTFTGDTVLSMFACNCNKGRALPNAEQPHCCGHIVGIDQWCVKAATAAVANPICTNQTTAGMPSPIGDFYRFMDESYAAAYRCVPGGRCNSAFCNNPDPPASVIIGC